MAKKHTTNPPARELPPDVRPADLAYPKTDDWMGWDQRRELGLENLYALTFYRTQALGWVLTTLHISNPSRRQAAGTAARTYATRVADGKTYTVGRGPHVLDVVEVYLTKDNLPRLERYVKLWREGMAAASTIRDRISSRRAQGQLYRAEGLNRWNW